MSYNDYMYAVDRSDEYLAHYGIKGMKWGVRKAIASGNSRKLSRQYRKAAKKLAKLEKRAANGQKYARRAARLGAGAALAGGLAAAGTGGVATGLAYLQNASSNLKKAGNNLKRASKNNKGLVGGAMNAVGTGLQNVGNTGSMKFFDASRGVSKWGKSNDLATGAATQFTKLQNKLAGNPESLADVKRAGENALNNTRAVSGITNNAIARVGAAALGAGLAGAAGYNAYRAATTKRAAKKAQQFRSEMNKAFAGTEYAKAGSNTNKKRRRR